MKKRCPHCKRTLPIDAFALRARGDDRRQSWCRSCVAAANRARKAPDLVISDDPGALSVEEVALAYLALAAHSSDATDPAAFVVEAVETWRKIWPTIQAVAADHGVTMTQPVGWDAASRIVGEAQPYLQAELEATR